MATRFLELMVIGAVATAITIVMAVPILRAPSERLFGAASVGRHHDPFTAMARFARNSVAMGADLYAQPVTDNPGAWLTSLAGPVAAFNILVLTSFPLSAMAAYALARHLSIPEGGAAVAALAFAFSPFHLAQAAYHPHIAQTQWIPLYLLALWRCLDTASVSALAALAAATACVALSNFYGGLIMAVVTPTAVGTYWVVHSRPNPQAQRRLALTMTALLAVAVAVGASVVGMAAAVLSPPPASVFPRAELSVYAATWHSYLLPPVVHPVMGSASSAFWARSGVREGLLEHQVSVGWGLAILSSAAGLAWWRGRGQARDAWSFPVLASVAAVAFVCSLSPEVRFWGVEITRPSAWLHMAFPVFRAYARFGVLVQLMVALMAGCGVSYLWRDRPLWSRCACAGLVALALAEYIASPAALSRDVLPTTAHRWVMDQPNHVRAFDCAPPDIASVAVPALTDSTIAMGDPWSDCTEPHLRDRLAALGFNYLIVQSGTVDGAWMLARTVDTRPGGAVRPDGRAIPLAPTRPVVYAGEMIGFFRREHDESWSWRWMGASASWILVNTSTRDVVVDLDLEMSAFNQPRSVHVALNGHHATTMAVELGRRRYRVGDLRLAPGFQTLTLQAVDPPTSPADVLGTDDQRRLSIAVGTWEWALGTETP